MPAMLEGLPGDLRDELARSFKPICGDQDQNEIHQLALLLALNPLAHYDPTNAQECSRAAPASGFSILAHHFIDEPDFGMDQNLPDSADPSDDRPWMGGKTGVPSQGFRHMYFGGIKIFHPLRTFQIPPRPLGQAPQRVDLMAREARKLMQAGQYALGYRTLAWALHYTQDLAQPYHATQIPNLELVPWPALFEWPPSLGFKNLVRETTRAMTNYHWAFESYVYERMLEPESPFTDCLKNPEKYANLERKPASDPHTIALQIAAASIELASSVGKGSLKLFGRRLEDADVYLPEHRGVPDYHDLATRTDSSDLVRVRSRLEHSTCQALANAALGSRQIIRWVLAK